MSNAAQVDNNGLDAVTLAFDLGLETLHLVAVEGVGDIAANVDVGHIDGIDGIEVVDGGVIVLLLVQLQRADEEGVVWNVDEGYKRHAVDAVSGIVCRCVDSRSRLTRLAVGAVDGTAGYPRTAKFLQFGGRFDSEGETLARIHIPQLSDGLVVRIWCFRGPQGKSGGLNRSLVVRLSKGLGRAVCCLFAGASGSSWEAGVWRTILRGAR